MRKSKYLDGKEKENFYLQILLKFVNILVRGTDNIFCGIINM